MTSYNAMKKIAIAGCLILILSFGAWLRLTKLARPDAYMFDEVYHVPTVKLIARGDIRAYQWWHLELTEEFGKGAYIEWLHPPLAKLIQAAFDRLSDGSSFFWRLPSALMGVCLIGLVFLLTRSVWPQCPASWLIAAFLASIDGLAIAMSRIAMNDIFVTTMVTAAIWCYWEQIHQKKPDKWLWGCVIFTGLACACKWSGILLLPFFAVWELIRLAFWREVSERSIRWRALMLASVISLIYLLSYGQFFYLGGTLKQWTQLQQQIVNYQFSLDATHPFASRAYQWPLGLSPVLFFRDHDGWEFWNAPFYPSWYLALGCLTVAVLTLLIDLLELKPRKIKKGQRWSAFVCLCRQYEGIIFLLLGYFSLWLPWIFSPRIMYFHHYLPALPCLWALAGGVLGQLLDKPISKSTKTRGT